MAGRAHGMSRPTTPPVTGRDFGIKAHLASGRRFLWVLGLLLAALFGSALLGSTERPTGLARTPAAGSAPLEVAGNSAASPGQRRSGWKLVWRDEFSEPTCPDKAKWVFEHGFVRNKELQWYEPGNASCRHGVLDIEARPARKRNPDYDPGSSDWTRDRRFASYTSASMATKRSFTYGRFEMRARIDTSRGTWPAFWTLGPGACPGRSTRSRPCVGWPESGEVDIMEYYRRMLKANVCKPAETWEMCRWSSAERSLASLGGDAWSRAFHVWAMQWNARTIDLYLDGKLVNQFAVSDAVRPGERNPYLNRPQYLLLSLALGGTHGGDPTHGKYPAHFEVDYVRVYQHQPPGFEITARRRH
jgi:beta-glucanase (GH16 family)